MDQIIRSQACVSNKPSEHFRIQHRVQRLNENRIAATLETRIEGALAEVFDFVAAEDVLPKVLTGYGLLPAVVKTSGNTGPWDRPGSSRTVHLSDGTTAREEVTTYRRPEYFAYKTSEYTFALRFLATGATGEWWRMLPAWRHPGGHWVFRFLNP
jgi:hypothetical protein